MQVQFFFQEEHQNGEFDNSYFQKRFSMIEGLLSPVPLN